jgi:hypothetical protein
MDTTCALQHPLLPTLGNQFLTILGFGAVRKRAYAANISFEVCLAHDKSRCWEAPLFNKRRYLRGIRNKGGSSGMEYPAPTPPMHPATTSYRTAANDPGPTPIDALLNPQGMLDENARRFSGRWSFTHALWLGLIVSALLWSAIAVIIHYF